MIISEAVSGPTEEVPFAAPILSLRNISKRYGRQEGLVHALCNVSFKVRPSTFVALTGPSGSGKSTLLNILGLIDVADEGDVRFEGVEIKRDDEKLRLRLRREHFGFVFQSYNLVPTLTALENVEVALFHKRGLSPRQRREQAREMLRLVGLEERMGHLAREMSGGQQQRVAVARALVRYPRIVIADEPTANLDARNAMRLMELMETLRATTGAAFVVSTHDHRMLRYFQTVVTLEDGKIKS